MLQPHEIRNDEGYRLEEIPEYMRARFKQAPIEYGSLWWLVSMFNRTPWEWVERRDSGKRFDNQKPANVPDEYTDQDPFPYYKNLIVNGLNPHDIVTIQNEWRKRWKDFIKFGSVPDGFSPDDVATATDYFTGWNMGKPSFFLTHSTGWKVKFLDSLLPTWGFSAHFALDPGLSDNLVSGYQQNIIQNGFRPERLHGSLDSRYSPEELKDLIPEKEALAALRAARSN